ncbi:MAG: hypothetical protein SFY81_03565 [Verrucomicrobiota bacterium]|nr:hypothetical protein [Verrucomicrobiota bacterium]
MTRVRDIFENCTPGSIRLLFCFLGATPALLLAGLLVGCVSLPPLVIDQQDPGWRVLTGQAIWHPPGKKIEITGDLLVALHQDGRSLVQFTKTPFPIVNAQFQPGAWQVEFPAEKKRFSGKGDPSHRLSWLQVPSVLRHGKIHPAWKITKNSDTNWILTSLRTDEVLECYLDSAPPSSAGKTIPSTE